MNHWEAMFFWRLKSREQVSKELRCLVEFEQVWWEVTRVDVDLYSLLPPKCGLQDERHGWLVDFGMNVKIRTVDGTSIRSQRPKGRSNPWWNTHEMNCETFNHRSYLQPTIDYRTMHLVFDSTKKTGLFIFIRQEVNDFWNFQHSCSQES